MSRDGLKEAIFKEGGARLSRLQEQIKNAEISKQQCLTKSNKYSNLLQLLDLRKVHDLDGFNVVNNEVISLKETLDVKEADINNSLQELEFVQRSHNEKLKSLDLELASLKSRKNNIDSQQINIRQQLCQYLQITEDKLPFVGELIQVRESDLQWEGAIERILHNFALSLLVPDELYKQVSAWVEKTNLKGRLVYYRITQQTKSNNQQLVTANSLIRKIAVKPESDFYDWLKAQLAKRFNYICCELLQDFTREKQAVTLQGQIKSVNNRHEKDDRRDINNRRFYVLGWSNQQKIALLEQAAKQLLADISAQQQLIKQQFNELKVIKKQLETCVKLAHYQDFSELDWAGWLKKIETWQVEKQEIEENSNQLKVLQQQLEKLEDAIKTTEKQLNEQSKLQGSVSSQLKTAIDNIVITQQELQQELTAKNYSANLAEILEKQQQKWQLSVAKQVEHIASKERLMHEKVQYEITKLNAKQQRLENKVNSQIREFRYQYKAETIELLDDIVGLDEYKSLFSQLQKDDLPRFEAKFKEQLNKNIINQITHFSVSLKQAQQEIKTRIDKINLSLFAIDYNPNRYIRLELANNLDVEIKSFYQELKVCTDGTFTGTDETPYAEEKFLQVKVLIDRFKGREGYLELDKKWTEKVTDVRNFFLFSASERWREDDTEYEHYSDSSGKSGGQKEKLAYTVLAASLAYQFGLEFGEVKSRSFRFVVIDEAFGRGSDESAKYGLELFKMLNLQLLVVTPKQKIHVIEPFVSHVGFVSNADGRESQLRTLSIEEHLAEKNRRQQLLQKITINDSAS